ACRGPNVRLGGQSFQIVNRQRLRTVVSYQQETIVQRESHGRGLIVGSDRTDLGVVFRVVHQNFVGVLAQDIIAIPDRVGSHINQGAGNIQEGSSLVGLPGVDQHPNRRRHVDR